MQICVPPLGRATKGNMNKQLVTTITMIFIATAATLIPHPPNFTPLAATALFAGAHLSNRKLAFAIPLGALFLRDVLIGLHVLMPFTYACTALSVCLGFWLKRRESIPKIAAASLSNSIVFFLVTNFGVWLALGTFPRTANGLVDCYVAGIPYFRNTIAGDLLYTAVIFGSMALAQRRIPILKTA
jgi:hypothetical protein